MTESEWLTSTDPGTMLAHLGNKASARKLYLFAGAAGRQVWDVLRDSRSRHAIELTERFADGKATEEERQNAWVEAVKAQNDAPWDADLPARAASWTLLRDIVVVVPNIVQAVIRSFARKAASDAASNGAFKKVRSRREQAVFEARGALSELIREVFGNPFRITTVDPAWLVSKESAVRHLAEAIYEERRWEDMPILADALEDAGCDDEEMLRHCREPHRHTLGCWVLDLLLGNE